MNAKEYLNRIRAIDFQILKKKEQLARLEDMRGQVRGFDYSGVKVQTSSHGDEALNKALEIMELEQDISKKMLLLEKTRAEIMAEISTLPKQIYVELLTLRYCDLERFEQIAVDMCFSFDRIRHLHGEALKSFQREVLDKKVSTQ